MTTITSTLFKGIFGTYVFRISRSMKARSPLFPKGLQDLYSKFVIKLGRGVENGLKRMYKDYGFTLYRFRKVKSVM